MQLKDYRQYLRIFISSSRIKSNNNLIQFLISLRAELNSQWPITKSARIPTTAIRQHAAKLTKTTTI
jgi:hypothetical protein